MQRVKITLPSNAVISDKDRLQCSKCGEYVYKLLDGLYTVGQAICLNKDCEWYSTQLVEKAL